jgi:hypothetical protein
MDATYATGARVKASVPQRFVFAPHFNHRFGQEQQVARLLWLDQHLKGGLKLPATPTSELDLKQVPVLRVTPTEGLPIKRVDIFYSVDADPRARFWRDAGAEQNGKIWSAKLPMMDLKQPLFAFANVFYQLPKPAALPRNQTVDEVCISSLFHEAKPKALKAAGAKISGKRELVIDDFTRGFHDWFTINGNNRPLWQHWTRKVTDPKWRGPDGAVLALTIQSQKPNVLAFVLKENAWRGYRGKERVYVAEARLKGGAVETVRLGLSDFKSPTDGASPKSWAEMDQLGICAKYEVRRPKRRVLAAEPWRGEQPVFKRLEWWVSAD